MFFSQVIRSKHPGRLILILCLLSLPALAQEDDKEQVPPAQIQTIRPDAPEAVVMEDAFDAGTIIKGNKIEHTFIIKNTGKAALEILSAKPGCGCTVASFDRNVRPGAEGKIFASVETVRFKGPITKSITVTTNDPKKNSFVLNLKADVITYVDVLPSESAFIRAYEGEAGSQSLEIRTTREKPLVIQKVELDNPQLKYALVPPIGTPVGKDQSYKLTIETPSDISPGNYGGIVKVATNVPEQALVSINYNVNIQKLITVSPPQVYMNISTRPYKVQPPAAMDAKMVPSVSAAAAGSLEAGKDYPVSDVKNGWAQIRFPDGKLGWAELKLLKPFYGGTQNSLWVTRHLKAAGPATQPATKGNDPTFVVKEAKSDLSFLTTRLESKQGGSWLVTLLYEGALEAKTFQGKITLATNDAKEPEIVVPVQITVGQMDRPQVLRPPQPLSRPDGKTMAIQPGDSTIQPLKVKPIQPPPGEKK